MKLTINLITNIITDAPKDLISKLLVVDATKRISIKEALEHSFFHTVVSDRIVYYLQEINLLFGIPR